MARSYLAWGERARRPRPGAIAVLEPRRRSRLGHVGFLSARPPTDIILLGGNQGDAVTVAGLPPRAPVGLRWPSGTVIPDGARQRRSGTPAAASDRRDLRARPRPRARDGGRLRPTTPTIPAAPPTSASRSPSYARDKGVELTAANFAALKAELKAIPPATVRRIYRDRYWLPAPCPELPPPLAFFHFDAAVNQGVTGAARMLQQAVGADIDGEIGPDDARRRSPPIPSTRRSRSTPTSAAGATARSPPSGASAGAGSPASTPRSPLAQRRSHRTDAAPSSPPPSNRRRPNMPMHHRAPTDTAPPPPPTPSGGASR